MKSQQLGILVGAAGLIVGSWASTGHAQGEATVTTTTTTQPTPIVSEQRTYTRPNRPLLVASLATLAISYTPAFIVAATSPHVGDNKLFIPVIGPWWDLAERPKCGDGAGKTGCRNEFFNDSALILAGIAHAAGLIGLVSAFFIPEERKVTTVTGSNTPIKNFTVHFTPTTLGRYSAPGVAAVGTW